MQVWPKGSLEEVVQNLVKSWEMELSHKTKVTDFKTIDHEKFCISVNGELHTRSISMLSWNLQNVTSNKKDLVSAPDLTLYNKILR